MEKTMDTNEFTVSAFSLQLLREEVIPEILGKECGQILYWAGKTMARKFKCETVEDIVLFFEKAEWGTLHLEKGKKDELLFSLSSPLITERLNRHSEVAFGLEAGFLAESLQEIKKFATETHEELDRKNGLVTFTVRSDMQEEIV